MFSQQKVDQNFAERISAARRHVAYLKGIGDWDAAQKFENGALGYALKMSLLEDLLTRLVVLAETCADFKRKGEAVKVAFFEKRIEIVKGEIMSRFENSEGGDHA